MESRSQQVAKQETSFKAKALASVLMGTVRKFALENPEMGITLGDTQVALSRTYDELTRRAVREKVANATLKIPSPVCCT